MESNRITYEEPAELISVREAATQCGRNAETVRRWIWAGKLPAEKLGNQLFIRRQDLAAYCRETFRAPKKLKVAEGAVDYSAGARTVLPKSAGRAGVSTGHSSGSGEGGTPGSAHGKHEDQMNDFEKGLREPRTAVQDKDAKLAFLEKATAIRDETHARTGAVFSAETMVRELREEREHELE